MNIGSNDFQGHDLQLETYLCGNVSLRDATLGTFQCNWRCIDVIIVAFRDSQPDAIVLPRINIAISIAIRGNLHAQA